MIKSHVNDTSQDLQKISFDLTEEQSEDGENNSDSSKRTKKRKSKDVEPAFKSTPTKQMKKSVKKRVGGRR